MTLKSIATIHCLFTLVYNFIHKRFHIYSIFHRLKLLWFAFRKMRDLIIYMSSVANINVHHIKRASKEI